MGLRRRKALVPFVLLGPGLAWLVVFFAIPALTQLSIAVE